MPQFFWKGINLSGSIVKGYAQSRSHQDIQRILLQDEIALLQYKIVRPKVLYKSISKEQIIYFFKNLALLLDAGVFIDEALHHVGYQTKHKEFKRIIVDIMYSIQQGSHMHEVLYYYPHVFNPLIVHMIKIGEQTGSLALVLQTVSDYLASMNKFTKKIKKVSLLPIITLSFFLVVTIVLLVYIVPAFADIFTSSGKDIPQVTRLILSISAFLVSAAGIFTGLGILIAIILMRYVPKPQKVKKIWSSILLNMPFINSFIYMTSWRNYFQALEILVTRDTEMVSALCLSKNAIHNEVLKEKISHIAHKVEEGSSLSNAFESLSEHMILHDVKALIDAGEQSAQLGFVLAKVTELYNERINRLLYFITTLVQPLLMIILGLLISILIIAIYVPVFTMADVIT